jgi:hypothetical protein
MTPVKITAAAPGTTIAPLYSTVRISSVGSKWVLLEHPEGFMGLYTGTGTFVRELPAAISTSSRAVWSRTDPNVLTYLTGNMLESYNVASNVSLTLHVFTEYATIDDGGGEADLSLDGDHRVLSGIGGSLPEGATDIFIWTLSAGTKGPVIRQSEPFDALKISANNHILLSRLKSEDPTLVVPGVLYGIWDITASPHVPLLNQDGHGDVGIDTDGTPILLVTNSDEKPITLADFPNGVVKVRIADGKQTGLISFPWTDAVDITMPASGPVCYVSTYGAGEPSGNLYRMALDGSSDVLILAGINHAVQTYDGQPKFCVSAEGDRGWYAATEADGVTVNTYLVMLNGTTPVPALPVPLPSTDTRIDYSPYVGKSEFVMVPRPDGAVDIYERKL